MWVLGHSPCATLEWGIDCFLIDFSFVNFNHRECCRQNLALLDGSGDVRALFNLQWWKMICLGVVDLHTKRLKKLSELASVGPSDA